MTDYLKDRDLPPATRATGAWKGIVAADVTDLGHKMNVIVPAFGPDLVWERCRWQSRDDTSLPAKGDTCLVVFDNDDGEPWVPLWWPFAT